jgi:RNA polymerase sigma-70 factor (ECF subfamily)
VDDRELSAQAAAYQRGDERGLRTLVEALSRTLIAVAYRYTRDWEWARDLTQETWVKVHERIGSYDPARSFRAWLFTVHRNNCLSHLRRAWVRQEVVPGDEALRRLRLVSDAPGPEDDAERREFQRRLLRALGKLGAGQRQVFVRVALERNSCAEVADAMGIKATTVRATLHFARRRLARLLREEESL